jgi:hypothetical protein
MARHRQAKPLPASRRGRVLKCATAEACIIIGATAALLLAASRYLLDMTTGQLSSWRRSGPRKLISTKPRIWIEHDFLSMAETAELLALLATEEVKCWDRVGSHQDTLELEGCAQWLAEHPLMRSIDERVAHALSVPLDWLEQGYVQRYRANYSSHQAHLDQSSAMVPARVASAIIYLEDQNTGAGHTTFPLAKLGEQSAEEEARRQKAVAAWNRGLRDGSLSERVFWPGSDMFELAVRQCANGGGIQPRRGAALFFEHRVDGLETIEVVHASCTMATNAPTKHAVAKFACDGPVRR